MEFYEKMYTEDQLVEAYKRGFSNGIGISSPGDKRYDQDADKLALTTIKYFRNGSIATYKTSTKSNR